MQIAEPPSTVPAPIAADWSMYRSSFTVSESDLLELRPKSLLSEYLDKIYKQYFSSISNGFLDTTTESPKMICDHNYPIQYRSDLLTGMCSRCGDGLVWSASTRTWYGTNMSPRPYKRGEPDPAMPTTFAGIHFTDGTVGSSDARLAGVSNVAWQLPKEKSKYPLKIVCPDGSNFEIKYDGKKTTFTNGMTPYNAEVMRLSDECGSLKHELEEIKLENSDLRREKERLERRLLGRK